MSGGWSARLPTIVYASRMQPAHSYLIDYTAARTSGSFVRYDIKAWDRDASGSSTAVPRAMNNGDIDSCRAWRWSPDYS